jgi:hypothetical protein
MEKGEDSNEGGVDFLVAKYSRNVCMRCKECFSVLQHRKSFLVL